jgi:uncharacterized protein (TIGR03435 family)
LHGKETLAGIKPFTIHPKRTMYYCLEVRTPMKLVYTCVFLLSFALWGQLSTEPSFEVASVKPNTSGDSRASGGSSGGRLTMINIPLEQCIEQAYSIKKYQVSGPDWLSSQRFDIVAKAPSEGSKPPLRPMLQALLKDRFKLAFHRETKLVPAYALVVAKGGPRLTAVDPEGKPPHVVDGRGRLTGERMSMTLLADVLLHWVGIPVMDKTELKGAFNITLEWVPDETQPVDLLDSSEPKRQPSDTTGPSLFTALREQLGLHLEAIKAPVEMIVIDHVEKVPTEN